MADGSAQGVLEVQQALQDLSLGGRPSAASLRRFLSLAREHRIRDPESVARHGAELLRSYARSMEQEELWAVHEQVAVAAMETGQLALADRAVQNVAARFPQGVRATRLTGMLIEAHGKFGEASDLYDKVLEKEPANPLILKRLVGVKRGQGDLPGAVEALKRYLDTQMTDWMAWEELADLYLQLQMYPQAVYCLEELLLHQPASLAHHLLLADTLYTMGGTQHWRTARSYYSGVVELSGGRNVRALYGVCTCAAQLAGSSGGGSKQQRASATPDDDGGLPAVAAEALLQRYAQSCPDKLPLVKRMLKAQGLV